jgi:hypothetical protein
MLFSFPWRAGAADGRVEAGEAEAGDVVQVRRVGHDGERLPVDGLQERLVGGQIVDVAGEPQLLQDLQVFTPGRIQ